MLHHPTTIRLPKDLKAWLKALAKREQRTFSAQIIFALDRYRKEMIGVDKMLGRKL